MNPVVYRKNEADLDEIVDRDQAHTRIVHRIGSGSPGLFPGWGPKL
jgi:hypothetical protein